ncbi:MAG TPA: glyoxalase superfamily protein [Gaiellaceae bacterium]|nr:glyoxalase superfamily protein [Gaiellaceae bacterium]
MSALVPFLRASDARVSAAWWARLGFEVEWEHRFAPHLPLFLSLRRGGDRLFLSEHEGDAPPSALVYLYVDDADATAAAFGTHAETADYGLRETELTDPAGNRVRVGSPLA